MKKKKQIPFLWDYLMVGILPMLIVGVLLAAVSVSSLKENMREDMFTELKVAAEQVNQYFMYDVINNGTVDYEEYSDHDYIESLQANGIELTIFEGDTRFLTSLKNANGSYNEGTQASSSVYAEVKSGKDYSDDNVTINGAVYYVYYEPIYDGNGNFWGMAFAGKLASKVDSAIQGVVRKIIMLSVVAIVVLCALITLLAKKLQKTLKTLTDGLGTLKTGDVSVSFDENSFVTEFSAIGAAGNALANQLRSVVGEVVGAKDELVSSVTSVSDKTNSNADSIAQINNAVAEVADTSQAVAQNAQNMAEKAIELGNNIDRLSENVSTLQNASEEINRTNKEAAQYMDTVMKSSEESVNATNNISAKITETNEAVTQISACVQLIEELSSQTNLLSLNASIEAARAGEAGKGFAVVAEEIRKLADSSAQSAGEIKNIVTHVTGISEETVKEAERVSEIIASEQKFISDTQEKFSVLSAAVDESIEEISAINKMAKDLDGIKEELTNATNDLGAISEELGASAEEVAASCQTVASACEETQEETVKMGKMTENLAEAISFFKL